MQDLFDEEEMPYFNVRTANFITAPFANPANGDEVYVDIENITYKLSDYEEFTITGTGAPLRFNITYTNPAPPSSSLTNNSAYA
jgi:hypothetical protein